MSCSSWELQIEAFADGELEAEPSSELRTHLEECSHCRTALANLRDLRTALVRNWMKETAPVGLAEAIRQRLVAQRTVEPGTQATAELWNSPSELSDSVQVRDLSRFETVEPFATTAAGRRKRPHRAERRWFVPLASLAAVLLVVVLYRIVMPPASVPRTLTMVAGDKFFAIRDHHASAVAARGSNLSTANLPNEPSGIAQNLSAMMELKVIAPDLSREGYSFLSGGPVLVGSLPGAQMVYRSASRGLLSVFTMGRMEGLGSPDTRPGMRSFFVSTLNTTTVVAWHEGPQTYAFCSELKQEELLQLIDDLPTAERGILESIRSVLAVVAP